MSRHHRPVRFSILGLLATLATAPVSAADHSNLETGLPLVIEDAYPTKANNLEVQGILRYERTRHDPEGANRLALVARFEAGIARNTQLTIEVPYRLGNATETRQGNFAASVLYNFNNEGTAAPALAAVAGFDQPFGRERGGIESELGVIATKSLGFLGRDYVPRRLHVNALWFHNYDRRTNERKDRYRFGAGYSQPVANDWVLLGDVYRETDRERGKAQNFAEFGTRYQMDPLTVLSAGLGAGFGPDSPKVRVIVGFQRSLTFPY